MSERIPESNYQRLQHFISHSQWSAQDVMAEVARKTVRSFEPLSGATGLLLDESGNEKSGKKSVGVARQYIGNVGKVCNSQIGVYAALCRENRVSLVGGRLYLPKVWAADQKRCEQAAVPESERSYQSKPEIAWQIIEQLPEEVKYAWVGGDTVYGNSLELRSRLRKKGISFVLDVTQQLKVYDEDPEPYLPEKKGRKGARPKRKVSDHRAIVLKDLIGQIPDQEWKQIKYREGTKGKLVKEAVLKKVWVWKKGKEEVEEVELLISRRKAGEEEKYSLCFEAEEELTVETALFRQTQRYWVERGFQEIKGQLGMHQYQVRSWIGWHHHVALTMMALHFILETQLENKEVLPIMSCGDVKLLMAKMLKNSLDKPDNLLQTIHKRNKIRQLDIMRRHTANLTK